MSLSTQEFTLLHTSLFQKMLQICTMLSQIIIRFQQFKAFHKNSFITTISIIRSLVMSMFMLWIGRTRRGILEIHWRGRKCCLNELSLGKQQLKKKSFILELNSELSHNNNDAWWNQTCVSICKQILIEWIILWEQRREEVEEEAMEKNKMTFKIKQTKALTPLRISWKTLQSSEQISSPMKKEKLFLMTCHLRSTLRFKLLQLIQSIQSWRSFNWMIRRSRQRTCDFIQRWRETSPILLWGKPQLFLLVSPFLVKIWQESSLKISIT